MLCSFNRLYTILTPEELVGHTNPPLLTVGARAIHKHATRANSSWWGNINGMSEKQRNAHADMKIKEILTNVCWINIHTLGRTSTTLTVEVRTPDGYGARWDIPADFRGLVEPQNADLNAKKSKQS